MMIYDEFDKWVLWLQDAARTHLYFDTEMEARQAMNKLELAGAIIYQAQLLAKPLDEGPDVLQEYFDAGITFTDEDVAALGVTAAQVTACLTLLENVNKFFRGENPTNAVYRVTINNVRRAGV